MKSGLFAREPLSPTARRVIFASCIGFAVDFFDIYLPVLALAPVIGYFEPQGMSSTATTTIYYFTFAATLLGRPCGAVIFGHWADKIGRRRTTMISIAGFGALTGLIAFVPSYAVIGLWSLILLIVLRFAGGVFMGGEYTSNNTLALEMVPKNRRGLVGGLIQGAFPIGFAAVSLISTIMLSITSKAQYYDWGWRVPFLIGCALAFAFLLYYRSSVPESSLWQASEKSAAPLKELLSGNHLRTLGQIFLMMSGFWLLAQPPAVLPGIMIQQLHVPSQLTSNGFLISSILLFFALIGYGLLGQMIGRRRALAVASTVALVASLVYYAMVAQSLAGGPAVVTALLAGIFQVLVLSPWGIVTTYVCERFPTRVRASGYGIGYSLAVVIPSFSGIYLVGLAHAIPYVLTPLVLVVLGAILIFVGAMLGPETREAEMHLPDLGLEPTARALGTAPVRVNGAQSNRGGAARSRDAQHAYRDRPAQPQRAALPGCLCAGVAGNVNRRPDAPTIPTAAVGSDGDGSFVYTIADNRIARFAVKTGFADNGRIEVTAGLSDKTPVVGTVKGAPPPDTAVQPLSPNETFSSGPQAHSDDLPQNASVTHSDTARLLPYDRGCSDVERSSR